MSHDLQEVDAPGVSVRHPAEVMTPDCIGVSQSSTVSFARQLTRQMVAQKWTVRCEYLDISLQSEGEAIYTIDADGHQYSFLVLAKDIDESTRTDRAVAQAWDFTFCLHEGALDADDLKRLRKNLPLQTSGRLLGSELSFGRANKSARQTPRVIEALAGGQQPDPQWFHEVGYLIRTTAVYGNGAVGIADYRRLRTGGPLDWPYAAQMLVVYMVRQFSIDYVNHLAAKSGAGAVTLAREYCRHCGVGNATGLGMAPFVLLHPQLIGRWVQAREHALAKAKAQAVDPDKLARFVELIARASKHLDQFDVEDVREQGRTASAREELATLAARLSARISGDAPGATMNDVLNDLADGSSQTTQEMLNCILIELFPEPEPPKGMACDEIFQIVPEMTIAEMLALIAKNYEWATSIAFEDASERAMFWYRSQVASEPRLGTHGLDGYEERALPIEIARDVHDLDEALKRDRTIEPGATIAEYLLEHPEHRSAVQRVHSTRETPFGEVRVNTIAADFFPLDILRLMLTLLGANRFDPKSDRWLRVTFFQGAPLLDEFDDPGILEKELFPVLEGTPC